VSDLALGGVHHVSLNVADAEVAATFYEEVLGLRRLPRPDIGFPGAWFAVGDSQVHLLEVPGHEAPPGQHFAFLVADLDATCATLAERGVAVTDPAEVPGAGRQAFLHDPSGNLIELNEPTGPAP